MKRRARRKRRYRLKPQVKIFLIVLAAVTVTVVSLKLFLPKKQYQAEAGNMRLSLNAEAVIIRDENAYYAEFDFGNMSFDADEGETVKQGDRLATIYKLGYTEDVAQRLYDVQKQIYAMQTELMSGINKPEVDAAEEKLASLKNDLQTANMSGDSAKVKNIENDIADAIESRNSLLRDIVQPTEELSALYDEEASRIKQLGEWTGHIVAGEAGRFSCYTDGLEQSLCMDKLEMLTVSQVKSALNSSGYSSARNSNNFIYRIVNPNRFCMAFLLDVNSIPCVYEGESYKVSFYGVKQEFDGKCISVTVSEKRKLCVFEFNADMGDLITRRTAKATITADFSGARVNKNAVNSKNGEYYINIVTSGKNTEKIDVEVLATDKNYAIIRAKGNDRDLVGSWYSTRKD